MPNTHRSSSFHSEPAELRLTLLGGFGLHVDGEAVEVAPAGQRVLALLALSGGASPRTRLAGGLWPDSADDRALANLRSAMWRMPEDVRSHIERHGSRVQFGTGWSIDFAVSVAAAEHLMAEPLDVDCERPPDRAMFAQDLLPYWDCAWVEARRERHRQLRLHALEALAKAQLRCGRPLDAVDTALQAVADEPLRESAQLLLLQAHLAAGNRAAVVRQYDAFRALLEAELNVEPNAEMRAVLASATGELPALRTSGAMADTS